MPKTCVVKNCKSIGRKESRLKGLTFHRLPAEETIRQKWLDNIRRVNKDGTPWVPYKSATVCSRHFKKSCFHGKIPGMIEEDDPPEEDGRRVSRQGRKKLFHVNVEDTKDPDFILEDQDVPEVKRRGKTPTQRRVLYPHAVPTEEMGIPTMRLKHSRPLPFPKRLKANLSQKATKNVSMNDAGVIETLGVSKRTWNKLSDKEREDQRGQYVMLTQSSVDHCYSSSVMLGAEKLADDNKRLRLLVEKLVHKVEAERNKCVRVQNSLAKACSMLEQCSDYDFYDHDGQKIARPKELKRRGPKKSIMPAPKSKSAKAKSKVKIIDPLSVIIEPTEDLEEEAVEESIEPLEYMVNPIVGVTEEEEEDNAEEAYGFEVPQEFLQTTEAVEEVGDTDEEPATMIYTMTEEAAQAVQSYGVQVEPGSAFLVDPSTLQALDPASFHTVADGSGKFEFVGVLP